MVDPLGGRQPVVPARHVKLLPFFQGDNAAHPDWAMDLKKLDGDHHSTLSNGTARTAL